MSQDTISATAEKICRALLGDARKIDCDIIESHIREMLVADPSDSAETRPVGHFVRRSMFGPWIEIDPAKESGIPLYAIPAATQAQGTVTDDEIWQRWVDSTPTGDRKAQVIAFARAILAAPARGVQQDETAMVLDLLLNGGFINSDKLEQARRIARAAASAARAPTRAAKNTEPGVAAFIEEWRQVMGQFEPLTTESVAAYREAILAAAAQGSEARNAARYRWIENHAHFTGRYKDIGGFGVCVKLEILERDGIGAAIDAEMKRGGERKA